MVVSQPHASAIIRHKHIPIYTYTHTHIHTHTHTYTHTFTDTYTCTQAKAVPSVLFPPWCASKRSASATPSPVTCGRKTSLDVDVDVSAVVAASVHDTMGPEVPSAAGGGAGSLRTAVQVCYVGDHVTQASLRVSSVVLVTIGGIIATETGPIATREA